jgi:hypothetical protein
MSYKIHLVHDAQASRKPCQGGSPPISGSGRIVEADDLFRSLGGRADAAWIYRQGRGLTLVERRGSARSFHIDGQEITQARQARRMKWLQAI